MAQQVNDRAVHFVGVACNKVTGSYDPENLADGYIFTEQVNYRTLLFHFVV